MDEKLDQIRRRLRDLHAQVDDLCARATRTPDIEAAVDVALDQLGSIRQVLAQGSIIEQKALLRGFIAGITLTPSQDRGVITWYQLPESL